MNNCTTNYEPKIMRMSKKFQKKLKMYQNVSNVSKTEVKLKVSSVKKCQSKVSQRVTTCH